MEKKIYISEVCGLCYGAKNAINKTFAEIKTHNVVLFKDILHNHGVMSYLKLNGASVKNDLTELKEDDFVIIRAHGEPKSTFEYFNKHKIKFLDCTCPNVKTIQNLIEQKNSENYKIIIVGKHGNETVPMHPEVVGECGYCLNPIVIEDIDEINNIDFNCKKYFLVVQTTFSRSKAQEIINKLKEIFLNKNIEFDYKNTICNSQKNIGEASVTLAKQVDIMLVIGSKNSSNSTELFNLVSKFTKSYFVEELYEVDKLMSLNEYKKSKNIGLTAGASTMYEDIEKVKQYILSKEACLD